MCFWGSERGRHGWGSGGRGSQVRQLRVRWACLSDLPHPHRRRGSGLNRHGRTRGRRPRPAGAGGPDSERDSRTPRRRRARPGHHRWPGGVSLTRCNSWGWPGNSGAGPHLNHPASAAAPARGRADVETVATRASMTRVFCRWFMGTASYNEALRNARHALKIPACM